MRGKERAAAALMVGILALSGCKSEGVGFQTPLPAKTEQAISAESLWQNISARERINSLELKQYPPIPNFDSSKELRSATAQFYLETTRYKINPDEMAANIFFVSPPRFLEEAQKDAGRQFSKEEIDDTLNFRLEMINTTTNQSFINIDLYKKILELLKTHNPEVVKQLGIRDFDTVVEKSLYLHIFSHMTQTEEMYSFDGFSLKGGNLNVPSVDKLIGFTFQGVREDGSPFFINGAKEAITERTAIIVGKKSGDYISFGSFYSDGAILIDMLNEKSGINDEEFIEYAKGIRPIDELFERWGSIKNRANPDKKAAIMALATIGLYVDGVLGSYDEVKNGVENRLKPK